MTGRRIFKCPGKRSCAVPKGFAAVPWLMLGACVCGSFMITGALTSKGVLGTNTYDDMTGVPCVCTGISGSADVEADWLNFICMIIIYKWVISKPSFLLLATCLHLRAVNKLATRRGAGSLTGCAMLEEENGTELVPASPVGKLNVHARSKSGFRVENPMTQRSRTSRTTAGAASKVSWAPAQDDQGASVHVSMAEEGEGGEEEEGDCDVWTIHLDDSSGFKYRYNNRTGATEWCEYEEQDANTIAEEDEGEGDEADTYRSMLYTEDDQLPDPYQAERQATQEDTVRLATALPQQLQHVTQDPQDDVDGEGKHQSVVDDTRKDWAENESARQERLQAVSRKAAPVHRQGSKVIGRQLKRFTSSAMVPSTRRLGRNAGSSNSARALSHHASSNMSEDAV